MPRRALHAVLVLLVPFFSGGCQEDGQTSLPVTSDTAPPVLPTETHALSTDRSTIPVPQGESPVIDGTMSPGEWENAAVETFADGSALLLMCSGGYLYLGIQATMPGMIVGNVFVDRGDEVTILHSSAALGTALYQKGEASWQQTQGFVWRCRKTDDGEAAQAERDAFLKEEHWVASNSRMGSPNELEYQIDQL